MNSGYRNVAIISIEASTIKTERNYFAVESKGKISLKQDKEFLNGILKIRNLSFKSIDFGATKAKMREVSSDLRGLSPAFSEIYVICDLDHDSYSIEAIREKFKLLEKELKCFFNTETKIKLLEYTNEKNKFEFFLMYHLKNCKSLAELSAVCNNFKNNDQLYEKVMGKGGKNLNTLMMNCKKFGFNTFSDIFIPLPLSKSLK